MRFRFPVALALGLVFALGPLAPVPAAFAQDTLQRIKEEQRVRLGVANEPPYGYMDEDGQPTGEAPDIAREVLKRIDPRIRIEGVAVPFGQLINELNAGKFDIIAAGMYITPERCRQINFSQPTYKMGEAFAVRKGNPLGLTDFESVASNHEAKVGIMAGAVEYNYAYEAGIPGDRALLYPNYDAALRALQKGEIDAIAMTSLTVETLIRQRNLSDIEATPQFFPEIDSEAKVGYGAFGFREEDQALLQAFNAHLKDFVGSEMHWATVEPYGFRRDMVPDKSAEELCQGSE